MRFCDFIADLPYYHDHTVTIQRMNKRHDALIVTAPLIPQLMQLDCSRHRLVPNSMAATRPAC
jgi:hypothetical protein